MVGLVQIGGSSEPANPTQAGERARKADTAASVVKDEVRISQTGLETAALARSAGESEADIRAERVAQVQETLDHGTYRLQRVLIEVAARITKYLSLE
jgi:anti-sigma28 factor (negative regulator of flagellin synthesis)